MLIALKLIPYNDVDVIISLNRFNDFVANTDILNQKKLSFFILYNLLFLKNPSYVELNTLNGVKWTYTLNVITNQIFTQNLWYQFFIFDKEIRHLLMKKNSDFSFDLSSVFQR